MKKTSQKGFAHLALVLLLVVVAVVAFAGYKVVKSHSTDTAASTIKSSSAQAIPEVKNTADLNTVESNLNNQNIDGNLNPSSFDQDTQSMY
jgi:uncharacterized protein (UPF0333 family)